MLPEPEAVQLGEQLTTMQDAYHRQAEVKIELQAELDRVHQDLEVGINPGRSLRKTLKQT